MIVLARGGGSFEDLLPFSDERLVPAVAACATPVVSAIGHEQDTPIVDHAADLRAGTPSLAAKLVVPDFALLTAELEAISSRAGRALAGGPTAAASRWRCWCRGRLSPTRAAGSRSGGSRCCWCATALTAGRCTGSDRERTRLAHARDRLTLLGPAATLERGYAIVQQTAGAVVTDAAAVAPGDRVAVRLSHGRIAARVEEVDEE